MAKIDMEIDWSMGERATEDTGQNSAKICCD